MGRESEIFDFLVEAADRLGESAVHQAWKRFKNRKARAIAAGATAAKRKAIPKAWIRRAFDRQNGRCARCGGLMYLTSKDPRENATGDHLVPHSMGGEHIEENMAAVHGSCNSARGNRPLWEDAKACGQSMLERIKLIEGTTENANG